MEVTIIQNRIYEVRGQKVMLDFDLAELYETETKYLKRAVRQHISRFPDDFMFELTREKYNTLRTQTASLTLFDGNTKVQNLHLRSSKGKHSKYLPFAFTGHGVTMLASILNSERAITINIAIVRAFIALRKFTFVHTDFAIQLQELKQALGHRIDEHDIQLKSIYDALENLLDKDADKEIKKTQWLERQRIGFKT